MPFGAWRLMNEARIIGTGGRFPFHPRLWRTLAAPAAIAAATVCACCSGTHVQKAI